MYKAPITRLHPTAFVVLIDRSGSMKEKIFFSGEEMPKSRAVALVVNSFIDELLYRARREGGVRDYYDIAVIGYSGDGIESLLSSTGEFTTPSRLAALKVRREQIVRERMLPSGRSVMAVTAQNMWIEPKAAGITPMCGVMRDALALLEWWCRRKTNATSHPPTVINITDGEASDGSEDRIRGFASAIRDTGTADGNTLLINIHLAKVSDVQQPVLFPSSPDELPVHRYARLLYDISSEMPENYHDVVASIRPGFVAPFRGMAYNSPIADLVAMMNIGSINSVML